MPDRAVVDVEMCPHCESMQMARRGFPQPECRVCGGTGYVPRGSQDPPASSCQPRAVVDTHRVECPECHQWTVPRAIVALSDDRQALVHLSPHDVKAWLCWRWDHWWNGTWQCEASIPDTGQDAHEVLAEWLEGRNG